MSIRSSDSEATARRGHVVHAYMACALILGASLALWQISRARCFSVVGPAICRVETLKPLVALTFDDGPTALGVDAVLPVLEKHGAQATFFLIGNEVARRPDLAARLVQAGHELGNHGFSHVRMIGRSRSFYDQEIGETNSLLRRVGGTPSLFRPPYGKKLLGLPLAVQRHQLRMVLWDVEDPQVTNPSDFATRVVAEARPGSIILLHAMYPANGPARSALPLILEGLETKGLQVVSVGALLDAAGDERR